MHKNPILFVSVLLACFACNQVDESRTNTKSETELALKATATKPQPTRYKVKDGKITYIYKGVQRGTEEVYFKDFGMTEIKFTETQRDNPFQGKVEQIRLITLMRDSLIYVIDRNTNNGRAIDNSLLYETAQQSATLDLDEVAVQMFKEKNGSIVGTDTIAGKLSTHWNVKDANLHEWRWNGIMMKTIIQIPRNVVHIEAISVDTVTSVPEDIFKIPNNAVLGEFMTVKDWIEQVTKPIERRKRFNLRDTNMGYDAQGNRVPKDSIRVN